MNVVFLIGKAAAGKDTVGQMFVDKGYKRVALADIMKNGFYKSMGLPYDCNTEDRSIKDQYRWSMIQYSENIKRFKGDTYWFDRALEPYVVGDGLFRFIDDSPNIVVTDIRRMEEVDEIISYKLFSNADVRLYHIDRDVEETDKLTLATLAVKADCFDKVIDNNKDIKHLKKQVNGIIRRSARENRNDNEPAARPV